MSKVLLVAILFLCACASSSNASGSDGGGACPDVSGTWTVTAHCDSSLVGQKAVVTQDGCSLRFAAPFDGFAGTVTADGKLTLTGPQSCTGIVSATTLPLMCTPGACNVTLSR